MRWDQPVLHCVKTIGEKDIRIVPFHIETQLENPTFHFILILIFYNTFWCYNILIYLADPGKARGCSTNTVVND